MPVTVNSSGVQHARDLIQRGRINKTASWAFSTSDGNEILGNPPDYHKYRQWFLGIDRGMPLETKGAYKYPLGKGGKIYRSALVAIRQRAAQQNATDIFDAAGRLLQEIDGE
jgi:hypothetical protein